MTQNQRAVSSAALFSPVRLKSQQIHRLGVPYVKLDGSRPRRGTSLEPFRPPDTSAGILGEC